MQQAVQERDRVGGGGYGEEQRERSRGAHLDDGPADAGDFLGGREDDACLLDAGCRMANTRETGWTVDISVDRIRRTRVGFKRKTGEARGKANKPGMGAIVVLLRCTNKTRMAGKEKSW